MHDIYSIEDLKQLIFEIRQLKPKGKISVKLVSGDNVGTIAVGVAKAGADIIHIAGHDGGTGAATLTSMKHAGLPWEIGLVDAHRTLLQENLRHRITLRVDGGLSTGRDIITAALLGAEEFDFGKLILISQGCMMARICEKNTCPAGIATHDPKYKKRYAGNKEQIKRLLGYIAEDVRRYLSAMGVASLEEITGRSDLLEIHPAHKDFVGERGLDLSLLLQRSTAMPPPELNPFIDSLSDLNQKILKDVQYLAVQLDSTTTSQLKYPIRPKDRAALATLNGRLATQKSLKRFGTFEGHVDDVVDLSNVLSKISFLFEGSAGQGFAVFNQEGIDVRLVGEANDSVAKSMSGGKLVVVPPPNATWNPQENTILGNCALYGATGGLLYVHGIAGDRFAIRNSGATAVVEGVGVQACEYMTRGRVVILGACGANIGAGMTGGVLYLRRNEASKINVGYVSAHECSPDDERQLKNILEDYFLETESRSAQRILTHWEIMKRDFLRVSPARPSLVLKILEPRPSEATIAIN